MMKKITLPDVDAYAKVEARISPVDYFEVSLQIDISYSLLNSQNLFNAKGELTIEFKKNLLVDLDDPDNIISIF